MPTEGAGRQFLMVGGADRGRSRFDPVTTATPSPAEIGAAYTPGDWLACGEPTNRADFLQVLDACEGPISLRTDGLAFTEPSAVQAVQTRGVQRICIPVYSIRPDAHDWLVGLPGAGRRALKAIRVCVDAGLQVHVDLTPSRPTAGMLMETVGVLGRLGVHTLWIRRSRVDWMTPDDSVALTARLGLLEPELKIAGAAASRLGLRVRWVGFSTCAVEGLDGPRWGADTWRDVSGAHHHAAEPGPDCGCSEACEGYPMDYIHRFGWTEFQRYPATRVPAVVQRVVAQGGTFPRSDESPPERVRIAFGAPTPHWSSDIDDQVAVEPSRVIRQRMVAASQLGARELYACNSGLLDHPDALDLLWEMTRLSFERVCIAGDLSPLASCSERVLRRLRGIHRADAVLLGPDATSHDEALGRPGAFDAIPGALQALRNYAGAETGRYAVLRSVEQLAGYLAWDEIPPFRMGRDLDPVALAAALPAVQEASVQAQLGGLLPEALWSGPRVQPGRAEPAWGPGVPFWVSGIDPGVVA